MELLTAAQSEVDQRAVAGGLQGRGLGVGDRVALLTSPTAELAPHPLARPMHYTSGTTGSPKGVWSGILDEAQAARLVQEELDLWGFGPDDRQLICSPFHHSVAIRFGGNALLAGSDV